MKDTQSDDRDLMNSNKLVQLTPEFTGEIPHGCLIGFKGLGGEKGITAAYRVWAFIKSKQEIQFILFTRNSGQHVVDNTWLTSSDLYINEPPIVQKLTIKQMPTTF